MTEATEAAGKTKRSKRSTKWEKSLGLIIFALMVLGLFQFAEFLITNVFREPIANMVC